MSTYSFSKSALQEAEEDYKAVSLQPEQREMLNSVAATISKYVSLSELAARGFVLFAIRDTQQDLELEIKNISKMSPTSKMKFIKTVFRNVSKRLISILHNPTPTEIENLNKAISKAIKYQLRQQVKKKLKFK